MNKESLSQKVLIEASDELVFDLFALTNWCNGVEWVSPGKSIPGREALIELYSQLHDAMIDEQPFARVHIPTSKRTVLITGTDEDLGAIVEMAQKVRTNEIMDQHLNDLNTSVMALQMENSFLKLKLKELGHPVTETAQSGSPSNSEYEESFLDEDDIVHPFMKDSVDDTIENDGVNNA